MGTSSTPIALQVTITEGNSVSDVVRNWKAFGGSAGLFIYSPSNQVAPANIQLAWRNFKDTDVVTNAADWFPYFDGGPPAVQQVTPAAGNAQPYVFLVIPRAFRIVAAAPVLEDTTYYIVGQATN
jgi:hypothetical protein